MRPELAASIDSGRALLAQLRPSSWQARVLSDSADGRSTVEYSSPQSVVIAKFQPDQAGRTAFAVHELLSKTACVVLRVPRALHYDEHLRVLLLEAARGVPGTDLDPVRDGTALERIGLALRELHALRAPLGAVKLLADHLRELVRPAPEVLAEAVPAKSALIHQTVAEILGAQAAWPNVPAVLLHRDFHLRQLFDDGACVSVIDWDLAALGDPAFDVAYFTAYLKTHFDGVAALQGIEAFMKGYAPDDALRLRVPVYERFNHLRRACRRFRIRDQGWERELGRMLDLL